LSTEIALFRALAQDGDGAHTDAEKRLRIAIAENGGINSPSDGLEPTRGRRNKSQTQWRYTMGRKYVVLFAAALLLGAFVPELAAQVVIHSHPGWLDSTTQEGFDVADGWPLDENDCCWGVGQYDLEGFYTRGIEPEGQEGQSAFWNPNYTYPTGHSYLWVMNEGAIIETVDPIDITEERPWMFVQFLNSDMNDGVAEIAVQEVGSSDWLTIGGYDTFGRGNNWMSIEGLPVGSYGVRVISRWNGRMSVPPNGACPYPAVSLQPARMGSTAAVSPERIHVTGGGWLPIAGGKASFSMEIEFIGGNNGATGTFTYMDHVSNLRVQSTELWGIDVVGDEAWISFASLSNSGTNHTVFAHVLQGGAGVGKFDIRITRPWMPCGGSPYIYNQKLTLGRGQIKIH
jgi:hypothetical protein